MSFYDVLAILFTFTVVIFVHELGHLLSALKFKVDVKKFSLGFGKELIGYTYKGIRFRISAIPLGGYVSMKGEDPSKEEASEEGSLMKLDPLKRIVVLFSGAAMNLIAGALIFSLVFFIYGMDRPLDDPVIGAVSEDSPAMEAGLREGDRILEIEGRNIEKWEDISPVIAKQGDEEFRLKIEREGEIKHFSLRAMEDENTGRMVIGITASFETVRVNFFKSIFEGFATMLSLILLIFQSIYLMLTGALEADLMGPIGIGDQISKAASHGMDRLLMMTALISVNLGIINLFPVPILDGGHIVFAFIEKIKGSPVNRKVMEVANMIGIILLLLLVIYVFRSDILRLR